MMPVYTIPAHQHDIPRNAVILDTNVLVAAFYPRDQHHEPARTFIDECSDPFVVPIAVLIETWGWIVGSRKYWEGGIDLLLWLNTPGNAELLPQDTARFDEAGDVIRSLYVDCVDALVSQLADDISRHCQFDPHIKIATYDTADIWRCKMTNNLQIGVLDLRSGHVEY